MTLTEHLEELRGAIVKILIIVSVSFVICYMVGDRISDFLLKPLRDALSGDIGGKVVYIGVLDKVLSQFQIAFWSSILLSSPLWFKELWGFIKPGLYEREIKVIRPFVFVSFILFCLGVCFGYFIVFPYTFDTLLNFGVQNIEATISLKDYLVLAVKVLVFLGVIFQLPNCLLIMGFMGIVTKYSLRSIRSYVYVAFAVVSAMLTPPDVITMLALWFPLAMLYEIGIVAVMLIVHPYLAKVSAET